jgi:hypothetical protein
MTTRGWANRVKRQWFAVDVKYPHGRTCVKLGERFGRDGPFLWACFLAACMRGSPQGQFVYIGEQEGLVHLVGMTLLEPGLGFSLDDFFTYTGQLKQTKKRRDGHVINVRATHWEEWQQRIKRDNDAERKAWNRQESSRDIPATSNGHAADITATEIGPTATSTTTATKPPLTPPRGDVRQVYAHWRKARGKTNGRYDHLSPGRRKKIEARLREFSADELCRAIDAVDRDPWEDRPLHDDLTQFVPVAGDGRQVPQPRAEADVAAVS